YDLITTFIPAFKVEKLAKQILQDEETARIVYRAMKESPFPDDLALVIKWDDRGFNDVPMAPGCRNGIAGQTIITHTHGKWRS
ncbi:11029_t:CDS:2, partial [Dentiscutata heterogama]